MLARYASDTGEVPPCPRCGLDEGERNHRELLGVTWAAFDCSACGLIWGFPGDMIDVEENRRKSGQPKLDL